MKKINTIVIIVGILISLFNSVTVNALNADRVIELRESGQTAAADAANNTNTTNNNNNNNPTLDTRAPANTIARPLVNDPLGGGANGDTDLKTIFLNILDVAQTIIIMLTTLYLIYAGFMFVTAKGDPARIKKARDALLWGFVGAGLVLCAEVIALSIGDTVKEVFRGQ